MTMASWSCFLLLFVVSSTSARSFILHNVTLSSNYSITAEDLLKSVTKSLVEYDKNMDKYIDWAGFDKTFKEMVAHDGPSAICSIGDVRKFFLQSRDYYFYAVNAIYGWCGQIDILMEAYVVLFTSYTPEVRDEQRDIIVNVLDEGIQQMSEALQNLDKSRDNLNTGVSVLTNLIADISQGFKRDHEQHQTRIHELNKYAMDSLGRSVFGGIINLIMVETKYKPDAEEIFENIKSSFEFMKTKMTESIDKALIIKGKLLAEIQNLVELKAAAKSNKVLIRFNSHNIIRNSATVLITKCNAYQTKHGLKI